VTRSSSARRLDVLQAHLTARYQLPVVRTADLDQPELLATALLDRGRDDVEPARPMRTQEVRRVRDADRLTASVPDRLVGADRRERLDRRRVEAAVHDAPRLVVALVGGDRAAHARRRCLIETCVEQVEQVARAHDLAASVVR
jgi:hypothetical protein